MLVEDQFFEMETDGKTREVRRLAQGLRWETIRARSRHPWLNARAPRAANSLSAPHGRREVCVIIKVYLDRDRYKRHR